MPNSAPPEDGPFTEPELEFLCSAMRGRTSEVAAFLAKGFRPFLASEALVLAARFNKVETIEELLRWGADPNYRSGSGATAATIARQERHLKVLDRLKAHGAHDGKPAPGPRNDLEKQLLFGAKSNNVERVKRAMEAGVDLQATDNVGETALTLSVQHRALDVLRFLLAAGIDVNAQRERDTVLDRAIAFTARSGHREDSDGIKAYNEYLKIVRFLIEHGARSGRELDSTAGSDCESPGIESELDEQGIESPSRRERDDQIGHLVRKVLPLLRAGMSFAVAMASSRNRDEPDEIDDMD